MATTERLQDFPAKASPTTSDIIYTGDAADANNEVQITIGQLINAYPNLTSIGTLILVADRMIYSTGANTFALTAITAVARTMLSQITNATILSTIGAVPLAGGTMTGPLILNADPSVALGAATKQYVDNAISGITIQGACRLATTGALTATYANGASGIGATLTNSGAQAALTLDGVATVVNDRILVKNQGSTFQNGIYTVTNIGSGATNWVLTRATDYDQVSEINPGDLVIITAGSTLTNSSWIETATVVTIGTDPITFSQFSAALPVSLATGGTGANLTASNGGIVYSGASALAILAGTATAGLALLSGASGAPSWSTSKPITQVITQRVTTAGAGTYTPTTGMQYVWVRAQAASGGSGGAATTTAGNISAGGSSGGGEYLEAIFTAAQIGANKPYSVGAKGNAGAAGANDGTDGGNTTFNTSFIIAVGGKKGVGGVSVSGAVSQFLNPGGIGGIGGSVATGTLMRQIAGGAGDVGLGQGTQAASGVGGHSGCGGSGAARSAAAAGVAPAANSGAGASGGATQAQSQVAGATGSDGFLEFIEFISI